MQKVTPVRSDFLKIALFIAAEHWKRGEGRWAWRSWIEYGVGWGWRCARIRGAFQSDAFADRICWPAGTRNALVGCVCREWRWWWSRRRRRAIDAMTKQRARCRLLVAKFLNASFFGIPFYIATVSSKTVQICCISSSALLALRWALEHVTPHVASIREIDLLKRTFSIRSYSSKFLKDFHKTLLSLFPSVSLRKVFLCSRALSSLLNTPTDGIFTCAIRKKSVGKTHPAESYLKA